MVIGFRISLYIDSIEVGLFALSDSNFKMDILSNGFKLRQTNGPNNTGTYIYAAFARNPFRANGGLAR